MEDIRYSELVFLQKLAANAPDFEFFLGDENQPVVVGLGQNMYVDMASTLLEELFIRFDEQEMRSVVARLRGEIPDTSPVPYHFDQQRHLWRNPRELMRSVLMGQQRHKLVVTFRGLRRIEELREQLRRDRILERFGVLLDFRYVPNDLRDALHRPADTPISVLYADLDKFKPVNDKFGHDAGDVVLKAYLKTVHDALGSFGTGYRGTGDEVVAIIVGQGHERAVELAEKIRAAVEMMECEHKGQRLPHVTTSIGVATSPPESRTADIESVAEERNREAKAAGRNLVVSAPRKDSRKKPS